MKNMRTKITVATILAVLAIAITSCGKTQYPQQPPSVLPSSPTKTTTPSGIDAFNTKWTSETSSIPLTNDTERRTVAYFIRDDVGLVTDNTESCTDPYVWEWSHDNNAYECSYLSDNGQWYYDDPTGDCRYGYKAQNYFDIDATCFADGDTWRTYFMNSTGSGMPRVYPAPQDPGNMVNDIKLRLGADIDAATRKFDTTKGAFLEIDITTSHTTATIKFDKATSFVVYPSNFGVNNTQVEITFTDDCGNLTLKLTMSPQGKFILSPIINFFNTGVSYKKASCYLKGLPNPQLASPYNTFPDSVAEGVELDTFDANRARLLKMHILNSFQEE